MGKVPPWKSDHKVSFHTTEKHCAASTLFLHVCSMRVLVTGHLFVSRFREKLGKQLGLPKDSPRLFDFKEKFG